MTPKRILVIQTAFIGDVILTLPLLQVLKRMYPKSSIDCMVIPRAADILQTHPAVATTIIYDKRGRQRGLFAFLRLARSLRRSSYDVAVVPHRSIRSALLAWLARIPRRVGFDTSAGAFLWTDRVRYEKSSHEIDRNLSLLKPLGGKWRADEAPRMVPSKEDAAAVDALRLSKRGVKIAVAPGTVWKTKQWPPESMAALCKLLAESGKEVVLIGGKEDVELCEGIRRAAGSEKVRNVAGMLSLRQSAELIRRCRVLVCNDSAPMHLAASVGTPVVAIFGATIPEFGFAPRGRRDRIVQVPGLPCRPCSIHGGPKCPIGTFDCMLRTNPENVLKEVGKTAGRG